MFFKNKPSIVFKNKESIMLFSSSRSLFRSSSTTILLAPSSSKLKLYQQQQKRNVTRGNNNSNHYSVLAHQHSNNTDKDAFFNKYLNKSIQKRRQQKQEQLESLKQKEIKLEQDQQEQQDQVIDYHSTSSSMPKSRTKVSADEAKAKTQAILKSVNLTLEEGPSADSSVSAKLIPKDWNKMYNSIVWMRAAMPSAVDIIGCHMLADREKCDKETQRWQTLVSLMLSSQTRDQMTAAGVKGLQTKLKGGLTVASVAKASEDQIRDCISMTCFYNTKAKHLKLSAELLMKEFDGKVPRNIKDILKMPGVGKKMAHIFKECEDGEIVGLGVDVHMARNFPRWKWVNPKTAKTPEQVMQGMQRWLPLPFWKHANEVMVGFGQNVCRAQNPLCDMCLARHWCPGSEASKKQKTEEKHLQTDDKKRALQDIEDLAKLEERTAPARQKLIEEFGKPKREMEWLAPKMDDDFTSSSAKTKHEPQWIRSTWLSGTSCVFDEKKKLTSSSPSSVKKNSSKSEGTNTADKKKQAKKATGSASGGATKKLSKYFQ